MGVHDFPIVGLMGAINHCFNNKSQTDPPPCDMCHHFDGFPAEKVCKMAETVIRKKRVRPTGYPC